MLCQRFSACGSDNGADGAAAASDLEGQGAGVHLRYADGPVIFEKIIQALPARGDRTVIEGANNESRCLEFFPFSSLAGAVLRPVLVCPVIQAVP